MDWLGMFVPRLNWRKPSTESLNAPDNDDLERLAELREQGSRLNLPHPVRGFLVFPAEAAARPAADLLRREGYHCTVRAVPDGSWVVTAVIRVVPSPGAITRLREQFEAVTSAHGGSYRGWDAPVIY
jgi:Regulator of ribonuclease activity B